MVHHMGKGGKQILAFSDADLLREQAYMQLMIKRHKYSSSTVE